jgi:hypothetical protein
MNEKDAIATGEHSHIFLGARHAANERRTWAAISLAGFMMVAEIAGGTVFGSLAVVADGFHMATHALALLIAAVAYSYARTHANDPRFVFGTGKLGDLAGFTSALVLAIIALIIGYEAAVRLLSPVTIHFDKAMSRSKCAARSLPATRTKRVLRPPNEQWDADVARKTCFAQENLPMMMRNRRGRSVSRDARGGPNPGRFHNNGKICVKLADSRGNIPGLALL